MKVYLLTDEQVESLTSINTPEATFVPCDHGRGVCVGEHDFALPAFADHKSMVDGWGIPLTECNDVP